MWWTQTTYCNQKQNSYIWVSTVSVWKRFYFSPPQTMYATIKIRYHKIVARIRKMMKPAEFSSDKIPLWTEEDIPSSASAQGKTLSPRIARMFWGIWALVILLWYAVFQISSMLYLIITWFIVSLALERFVQFRQHHGCSRWFALWLSYFLLIVVMLSGMIIMIPFVVTQLVSLLNIAFEFVQQIQLQIQSEWLLAVIESTHLPEMVKTWFANQAWDGGRVNLLQWVISDNISQIVSVGGESLKSAWSLAVNIVDGIFNTLIDVVLVMTIAVFFSIERVAVFNFLSKITKHPKKTYATLEQLSMRLWVWLEGQLLLCVIIALCVALWLWIISWFGFNLPNKFSLALIAWLTEFIPYLGPILGSIPALLVALIAFWRKWLVVVILLYRAIQAAENNFIVPAVMSQKLWINPLVIFLCMLLGASLFGFLWVLLAVPLAVIVTILVHILYEINEKKWDDVEKKQ